MGVIFVGWLFSRGCPVSGGGWFSGFFWLGIREDRVSGRARFSERRGFRWSTGFSGGAEVFGRARISGDLPGFFEFQGWFPYRSFRNRFPVAGFSEGTGWTGFQGIGFSVAGGFRVDGSFDYLGGQRPHWRNPRRQL